MFAGDNNDKENDMSSQLVKQFNSTAKPSSQLRNRIGTNFVNMNRSAEFLKSDFEADCARDIRHSIKAASSMTDVQIIECLSNDIYSIAQDRWSKYLAINDLAA